MSALFYHLSLNIQTKLFRSHILNNVIECLLIKKVRVRIYSLVSSVDSNKPTIILYLDV